MFVVLNVLMMIFLVFFMVGCSLVTCSKVVVLTERFTDLILSDEGLQR